MECTQRLECTQELCGTQNEKLFPEQIGFLGICGSKYPLKKGPNKIGRDPQTCSIILNLNSISRQHAVINILNKREFMLMDLESANKTKLSGKTLQPYIPQPLQNGDMIQFGDIFGVFRLLEEEDDLPMTQALDIPDTPVPIKHGSRINIVTTIPESPDVSDKDDSFIVPSQTKGYYQSSKTQKFIKPGKTISIQPVGTNKIDNIFWNSSKKSTSLNLDDSNNSLNNSMPAVKLNNKENEVVNDIHELETQEVLRVHKVNNDSTDSIYTANTQLPDFDKGLSAETANTKTPNTTGSPSIHSLNTQMYSSRSIHNLNTQISGTFGSSSIHNVDTQIPLGEDFSDVCKINEQQEMQFDLHANKDNDAFMNKAEIQMYPVEKENIPDITHSKKSSPRGMKPKNFNTSDEEILFEEVENEPFEDICESQAILSEDIDLPINRFVEKDDIPSNTLIGVEDDPDNTESQSQIVKPKCVKRNMRIKSDSSTDCEDIDILPTQKILEKKNYDDTTDCEEEMTDLIANKNVSSKTAENFEDLATQVIEFHEVSSHKNQILEVEDIPTQVIDIDNIEKDAITENNNLNTDIDFEDLPTQVLAEEIPIKKPIYAPRFSKEEEISPFKVPFNSALKAKNKNVSKTPKIKLIANVSKSIPTDDNKYYQDTQDIFEDLCTQRLDEPEVVALTNMNDTKDVSESPCTLETKTPDKLILDESFNGDVEEKVDDYVSNLSSQDVREVIGVDKLKKVTSDGSATSDLEMTPKKKRPFKFMDIDLPNSQEIKTSVSYQNKSLVTESSSESETEVNSEDQCTPILFRKKKKPKPDAKLDLTKKFDVEALPTRVITRVRKPSVKIQNQDSKTVLDNILKPMFIAEQEGEIDKEIITENITRLKIKNEKSKNAKCNHEPCKETKQADVIKVSITECLKKTEKHDENSENTTEKTKTIKEDKRKKREPRRTKKESKECKEKSSTNKNTKETQDSTIESKEIRHSTNSKENEILDLTELPIEPKRSTRSSRNKKTKENITKTENKAPSQERDSQTEKPKRKYSRKQKPDQTKKEEKTSSLEAEVRRSKRQRPVKEKKEEPVPKSIFKKSVTEPADQSTVYNLSSGSNSDTSRSFKRPALDESEVPSPKRTRSVVANNTSLRATPARQGKTHYVLFTAFPYEQVKVKLEKMGAIVVTDVMQSTVLLTRQIKRTFKLLCAVGLGKPIVGPNWVQACADTNMIVDPWLYLIKDEAAEKRFHFSLERTLTGKRGFLKGYNISSTPKVMPEEHEMKLIVECSGGTWKEGGPQWICVSSTDDKALWPALRERGAVVVSTEFILGGVLRQRVDIEINRYK